MLATELRKDQATGDTVSVRKPWMMRSHPVGRLRTKSSSSKTSEESSMDHEPYDQERGTDARKLIESCLLPYVQ